MEAVQTGLLFGALGAMIIAIILIYLIPVIAGWKLFQKAGIKGWKSLIPIYNLYLLYKISGVSGLWIIPLLVAICFEVILASGVVLPLWAVIVMMVFVVLAIIGRIMYYVKLPEAFGKGIGYVVGMFFVPEIIEIILGFGKAEYVGEYKE